MHILVGKSRCKASYYVMHAKQHSTNFAPYTLVRSSPSCVYRSYSWSANVCGRKEWLLFPPGEEDQLRDRLGNLPLDVTSHKLSDRVQYPNARRSCGPIRVVQGPGEVIFIPRLGSMQPR